jgi:hypothetical protein
MFTFFSGPRMMLVMLASVALFSSSPAMTQTLSASELKKLISTAATPQEHERIAQHYDAKAMQLEAEAKEHEALAAEYKRNPTGHEQKHPMSGQTSDHCKFFAQKFREAAKQARQLAADHRQMAKSTK